MRRFFKKSFGTALALLPALTFLLPGTAFAEEARPVRIAIIDTGISTRYIDSSKVEKGRNFVIPDANTDDRVGHGTNAAGLILGSEELGIEGSAPNAVLVPLVWYDKYSSGVVKKGEAETIAEAVIAAVDEFRCDIINISAGLPKADESLRAAVDYAEEHGALVLSAVGNDNNSAPDTAFYPAGFETVIGVGASDGDKAADFSQRTGVDVLAPGVRLTVLTNREDVSTDTVSGTSFACAYASGVCARWLEREPALVPAKLRERIYSTARDILTPGHDAESGYGLISAPGRHFSDVSENAWYADSVCRMYLSGLMQGTDAFLFSPDGTATRGMLTAVLWRMEGEPAASAGGAGFADVRDEAYYSAAVRWAADAEIVRGYDALSFGAEDEITREQLVTILHRYAKYKGLDVSAAEKNDIQGYSDAPSVSEWAVPSIKWACGAGILTGDGGKLTPGGTAVRSQTAALLDRFMQAAAPSEK